MVYIVFLHLIIETNKRKFSLKEGKKKRETGGGLGNVCMRVSQAVSRMSLMCIKSFSNFQIKVQKVHPDTSHLPNDVEQRKVLDIK